MEVDKSEQLWFTAKAIDKCVYDIMSDIGDIYEKKQFPIDNKQLKRLKNMDKDLQSFFDRASKLSKKRYIPYVQLDLVGEGVKLVRKIVEICIKINDSKRNDAEFDASPLLIQITKLLDELGNVDIQLISARREIDRLARELEISKLKTCLSNW